MRYSEIYKDVENKKMETWGMETEGELEEETGNPCSTEGNARGSSWKRGRQPGVAGCISGNFRLLSGQR